jgi:acyl carrier protein phosphodiesterase
MNFLAHIYLSRDRPEIMIGNFIGDFVKGRNLKDRFQPEIVTGIELHRAIDEFTDTHPTVTLSKNRLRPNYRHYAPVIADVFYDHFLAANWSIYHPLPLADFAKNTYDTLNQFREVLPPDAQRMLPYMVSGNWLLNYSKVEGIQRALTGMSRRTKFDSKMDESVNDLIRSYDAFGSEFASFFPELEAHADSFLSLADRRS